MNDFTFTDKGFSDYIYWQSQDRKTAKRINSLLVDIKRNGAMQGIGKPEPLKYRPGYSRLLMKKTAWYTMLMNCKILKSYHAEDTMMIKTAIPKISD